jgi:hypothetical protein
MITDEPNEQPNSDTEVINNLSVSAENTLKFQCKNWVMTFNNYPEQIFDIFTDKLIPLCSNYVFAKEVGSEGTPHIQGAFMLKKKIRQNTLYTLLGHKFYLDKMKGKWKDQKYCVKNSNEILTNYDWPEPLDSLSENELYDWQKNLLDILKQKADNRTIHWYWDTTGNVGKSSFARYLCIHHKAIITAGKAADMKYAIYDYKNQNNNGPKIVIADIPRSNLKYLSYTGIEEVKNGCFASSKYESGMCIINSPHVIIFANEEPDYNKMSHDRWNVICLD